MFGRAPKPLCPDVLALPEEANRDGFVLTFIGIFPAFAVLWAVFTRSKTVAAFAQLGNLHSRDDPDVGKQRSKAARRVRLFDQVCFTLGVLNVGFTMYLVGAAPQYFYLWHTPKAFGLTALRWHTFRKKGQHFMLFDFCYFANVLALMYLFVFPDSATMFQTLFMVANGPLAWSVLTFNQSLVFHSYAHMTSVFIHMSPMLLSYCLRWSDRARLTFTVCEGAVVAAGCENMPLMRSCDGVSAISIAIHAFRTFYLPWILWYYVFTFVVLGDYMKTRKYSTLYDRVVGGGTNKTTKMMNAGFRATGARHDLAKKAVYMSYHLVFGAGTMAMATLLWRSFAAHTLFVVAICTSSVWNGASYYFSQFARVYESDVAERLDKVAPNETKSD